MEDFYRFLGRDGNEYAVIFVVRGHKGYWLVYALVGTNEMMFR
jgi:hypothetical protein